MRFIGSFFLLTFFLACQPEASEFGPPDPDRTVATCPTPPANTHPAAAEFRAVLDTFQRRGFPSLSAYVVSPAGHWAGTAGLVAVGGEQRAEFCHQYFSGSVAKMYTVVAALQQVAAGRIALDDKIDQYLPASITDRLPNGHTATLRQLMNHTSGIPDQDDEEVLNDFVAANRGALPSPTEQLATLYDNAPWFAAGTGVRYSSANTLTLALLLDEIAPAGHRALIEDGILRPLGLAQTVYQPTAAPPRLVNAYAHDLDGHPFFNLTSWAVNYAAGSHGDAGIIAPAEEYYRFLRAVMTGQLLPDTLVAEMQNLTITGREGANYGGIGLGLLAVYVAGLTRIGHSGATLGGAASVYHYPERDAYLVLLANFTPEFAPELTELFYGGLVADRNYLLGAFEDILLR